MFLKARVLFSSLSSHTQVKWPFFSPAFQPFVEFPSENRIGFLLAIKWNGEKKTKKKEKKKSKIGLRQIVAFEVIRQSLSGAAFQWLLTVERGFSGLNFFLFCFSVFFSVLSVIEKTSRGILDLTGDVAFIDCIHGSTSFEASLA